MNNNDARDVNTVDVDNFLFVKMMEQRELERKIGKRHMVTNKLLRTGIRSNLSGFSCLVDAIIIYEPGMSLTKKDGLYDRVGEVHKIEGKNVERRIRHARNCFISDLNDGKIPAVVKERYLLGKADMKNGEFISTLKLIIEDEIMSEEVI